MNDPPNQGSLLIPMTAVVNSNFPFGLHLEDWCQLYPSVAPTLMGARDALATESSSRVSILIWSQIPGAGTTALSHSLCQSAHRVLRENNVSDKRQRRFLDNIYPETTGRQCTLSSGLMPTSPPPPRSPSPLRSPPPPSTPKRGGKRQPSSPSATNRAPSPLMTFLSQRSPPGSPTPQAGAARPPPLSPPSSHPFTPPLLPPPPPPPAPPQLSCRMHVALFDDYDINLDGADYYNSMKRISTQYDLIATSETPCPCASIKFNFTVELKDINFNYATSLISRHLGVSLSASALALRAFAGDLRAIAQAVKVAPGTSIRPFLVSGERMPCFKDDMSVQEVCEAADQASRFDAGDPYSDSQMRPTLVSWDRARARAQNAVDIFESQYNEEMNVDMLYRIFIRSNCQYLPSRTGVRRTKVSPPPQHQPLVLPLSNHVSNYLD